MRTFFYKEKWRCTQTFRSTIKLEYFIFLGALVLLN